jgi:hypothetical protein
VGVADEYIVLIAGCVRHGNPRWADEGKDRGWLTVLPSRPKLQKS